MSAKPSLQHPSRNDAEFAIKALEIEDEREKEAIRAFWRRERENDFRPLALKYQLTILFCAGLFGAFVLWEVFTWALDSVLKAFGR